MSEKSENSGAWVNLVGLGILIVCYAGALWNVISAKRQEARSDVIRLVHWQLELGVRDGLKELIDEFEAYKADQGQAVDIVQIPIPERAYTQYVTTQLIGGTAPDMIQIGKFPQEYLGRYFHPLSKIIQRPNPFNAMRLAELEAKSDLTPEEETLKGVLKDIAPKPWMDSFTDGLRGQFISNVQEYFGVGFSTFTVRMFYNKDMFKAALGHDRPPASYHELLEVCRQLAEYGDAQGMDLQPIASSKYQVGVFRYRYLSNLTADLGQDYDIDMSGNTDGIEKLMAMLRGDLTPWNPQYRAAIESVQNMAQYFPKGFMSLGREDSGFAFVQGRAGMITSGSWDALSYLKKIQDQPEGYRFEVGVFDMPLVDENDPQYGQYADGQSSEAANGTGFGFGITRFTRNEELCIEFLQFCTTPEHNTQLNHTAGWIPVIQGAVPRDLLKNFQPNFIGTFGSVDFQVMPGGKAELLEGQIYWPFISGEIDYDTYAKQLWVGLPPEAATDFKRLYEANSEAVPSRDSRRSAFLASVVFGSQDPAVRTDQEIRLQRAMEPLLRNQLGQKELDRMLELTRERADGSERSTAFNQAFFKALDREMSK